MMRYLLNFIKNIIIIYYYLRLDVSVDIAPNQNIINHGSIVHLSIISYLERLH